MHFAFGCSVFRGPFLLARKETRFRRTTLSTELALSPRIYLCFFGTGTRALLELVQKCRSNKCRVVTSRAYHTLSVSVKNLYKHAYDNHEYQERSSNRFEIHKVSVCISILSFYLNTKHIKTAQISTPVYFVTGGRR